MDGYKEGSRLTFELYEGAKYTTPPVPKKDKTLFHDKSKKDQKWVRQPIPPSNYDRLDEDAQIDLIVLDLERRTNGLWFYNDGTPTYITGSHYFYLTHWFMGAENEDGYPEYRESNRDHFYHLDLCDKDPNSLGEIYITNRRDGKTERCLAKLYNDVTLNKNKHGGLQSISMQDARDNLFIRRVVRSHKKIHTDFRPVAEDDNPKKMLSFSAPTTKTKKKKIEIKDSLDSFIDFEEASPAAYQGRKLFRIHLDEPGSMVNMDLIDWWATTSKCLTVGPKIIGKVTLPTTLEDMQDKGGLSYRDLWYRSDRTKLDGNGRTQSGLYRYFKPGYVGMEGFVDEYGNDMRDENGEYLAKIYLDKQRAAADPRSLEKLKRQFPYTVEEALYVEGGSVFPVDRINDQMVYNQSNPYPVRQGDFVWTSEAKDAVEFFDNPNGKWMVAWMPPQDQRNRYEVLSNGKNPLNIHTGGIGVDPFDSNKTYSGRASNGAIFVFRGVDIENPLMGNCFVCQYVHRPAMAEIFWDDVAKTCVFYGMKALIEDNKPGCIQYLEKHGFKNYVAKTQLNEFSKSTSRNYKPGISMTGEGARESLVTGLVHYMFKHIGKISPQVQVQDLGIKESDIINGLHGFCPFEELLTDWSKFDVNKWTDYDATVASGLAYMQSKRTKVREVSPEGVSMEMFFPTYSIRGNRSVRG